LSIAKAVRLETTSAYSKNQHGSDSQPKTILPQGLASGQTIDFLLSPKRDAAAAKRFFRKTLLDPANPQPRVINVDKNRAYPATVEELEFEGTLRRTVDDASAST
jgi:hypothetical protein